VKVLPLEVSYRISTNGKPSGEATLKQAMQADGGKSVSLVMTIRQDENRIVVKSLTQYLSNGAVCHAEQRIYPFGKPAVKEVVADFDPSGAMLTIKESSETKTTVPLKTTWPTANPSAFWFLNSTPEVGEVAKCFTFNLDTLKWERTIITFEGKTHKGNLVRLEKEGRSVETCFDDDGYPKTIQDSSGLQLTRL
jgi:hypothetical protein